MDLNPQSPSWTLDEGPYELADHCQKTESGLLILLNAWLDSEEVMDMEEDISTMNYWATRLRPLWYRMPVGNNGEDGEPEVAEPQNISEDPETIVVICNRSGTENGESIPYTCTQGLENAIAERGLIAFTVGATFAGSSSLFRLRQNSGRPLLLENMSRRQEGVCLWTT